MMDFFFFSFITAVVAATDVQGRGSYIDYDVNIRLKGFLVCKNCRVDSVAEIYISRSDFRFGEKIIGKFYTKIDAGFNISNNYSWGRKLGEDERGEEERINIFLSVATCGQKSFMFDLNKLPFMDGEFIIDFGDVYMKCADDV